MNVVAAIREVAVEAIDPKLVFLERASARLLLVQSGLMDLDEAFDGLIVCLPRACDCKLVARWERDHPDHSKVAAPMKLYAAPQSTYDALLYELWTRYASAYRNCR